MTCAKGFECAQSSGGCGEHFRAQRGFEGHRRRGGRCLSVDAMERAGWRRDRNGLWMLPPQEARLPGVAPKAAPKVSARKRAQRRAGPNPLRALPAPQRPVQRDSEPVQEALL